MKSTTTVPRSKKSRPGGTLEGNHNESSDLTFKSEGRAPAQTYAIRAKEEATALDVITGILTLLDTTVIVLIDPRSTHSYICTSPAFGKKMLIESTEFDVRVLNPIDQSV